MDAVVIVHLAFRVAFLFLQKARQIMCQLPGGQRKEGMAFAM
jgi:hypothetical protein